MAAPSLPLAGISVVITRPAGAGATLARRARALGARPVLLPGTSLRAVHDRVTAQRALQAAWHDDRLIFSSPAAVRFAAGLCAPGPAVHDQVCAVGMGTARALKRHGASEVVVPPRPWTSEGLLASPALAHVAHLHVSVIGAPGGRGLLGEELRRRGARVREVHVYRRAPARLDRRHTDAVRALDDRTLVLLSSAEALANLHHALPPGAWAVLTGCHAVVSSPRLAQLSRAAGFTCISVADSATDKDLLAAAVIEARQTASMTP